MLQSKYELRKREAQEIMRKAPHAFIARGNIIILAVLIIAFYFLNTFPLYERASTHIEVSWIGADGKGADSITIVLLLNNSIPKNVQLYQPGKLYLQRIRFGNSEYLGGRIDSIGYTQFGAPLLYYRCNRVGLLPKKGMIGHIEITVGEKTFISMLLHRFSM